LRYQKIQSHTTHLELINEFADVVLDNKSDFGDAALEIEGLKTKVCGTFLIFSNSASTTNNL